MNGNIVIKNASQLVTCSGFNAKCGSEMADLHIIEDGAVVIEKGMIVFVGKTETLVNEEGETGYRNQEFDIIDASNKAVLPGFVDSHTHFVFGGYRAEEFSWRLRGMQYMEIMKRGGEIVAGDNKSLKAAIKAADLQSINLLTAYEHPPGASVSTNPGIMLIPGACFTFSAINSLRPYPTGLKFWPKLCPLHTLSP